MTKLILKNFGDDITDVKTGCAIVQYPNRSFYIGQVKDGQPHGLGCVIEENDEIFSGFWRRGYRLGERMYHQAAHQKIPLGKVRTRIITTELKSCLPTAVTEDNNTYTRNHSIHDIITNKDKDEIIANLILQNTNKDPSLLQKILSNNDRHTATLNKLDNLQQKPKRKEKKEKENKHKEKEIKNLKNNLQKIQEDSEKLTENYRKFMKKLFVSLTIKRSIKDVQKQMNEPPKKKEKK